MIEHTRDFRRVKRLADWPIWVSRETYYLIDVQDGEDIGAWMFTPEEGVFTVHAAMKVRGSRAAQSAREAFQWIFGHTDHKNVFAVIPEALRHVQAMACHVGMTFYTVDENGDRCYFITDLLSEAA